MSIYTQTARFDTGRAMTETEMRQIAPSIFAVSAHESRSERFKPIPTIEVLRGLMKEGFVPVGAKQSNSRIEGKAPAAAVTFVPTKLVTKEIAAQ